MFAGSLLLTGLLLQFIAGCASRRPELEIQLSSPQDLTHTASGIVPPSGAPRDAHLSLHSALNETVSFRFTLKPLNSSVRVPRLIVAELVTTGDAISADAIRVYRMQEIADDNYPGWHMRYVAPARRDSRPLDVLVPIGAARDGWPSTLRAGVQYDFWVDVSIPKASSPGQYATALTFYDGDDELKSLNVSVEVRPFSLPEDPIPVIVDINRQQLAHHHGAGAAAESAQGDALLASTVRRLRRHGLTPVVPELAPIAKVGTSAAVELDWTRFAALVSPILDGTLFPDRRPLPVWPLPVQSLLGGHAAGRAEGATSQTAWRRGYLTACAEYFESQGWLARSYAVLPGVTSDERDRASALEVANLIREADPRIPIAVPWFPQDVAPYGWAGYVVSPLAPFADIWLTTAQFFDAETMQSQRSLGRKTWLAPDRPPFSGCVALHAEESTVRVLAQQAARIGAQGIYLGSINDWPSSASATSPADCILADDHVLLYPGTPYGLTEPVESVRLKHLRRSIQDVAYHVLLERHGLEHISRTIYDALIPYAGTEAYHTHFADGRAIGWPQDPAVFELARQIMARELIDSIQENPEDQDSAQNRNTLWRRLMTETRRLDAEVQGVRIRPRPGDPAFEAEVLLSFSNGRRVPVSGCVSGEALPEDWTYTNKHGCFSNLAPGQIAAARARWMVPEISCGPDGHLRIPLGLEVEEDDAREFAALLSWVVARPMSAAIAIDGDLRDWPPGADNVAGGFQHISQATPATGAGGELPKSQTLGFVTRDDTSLYIAIRCESRARDTRQSASKNTVAYDDMIPVGEELIEVLIDPLNTGSRSPDDLYHIVVKRGGVNFSEKGVRLDSPCGRPEPWVSNMEVASATRSDHWTVELRIPFAAFDYAEPSASVWGFNITRFDRTHREFSTWSGAKRNAYDPASLGNLYFPHDIDEQASSDERR